MEFFGTSQPLLVDQCLILMDGQSEAPIIFVWKIAHPNPLVLEIPQCPGLCSLGTGWQQSRSRWVEGSKEGFFLKSFLHKWLAILFFSKLIVSYQNSPKRQRKCISGSGFNGGSTPVVLKMEKDWICDAQFIAVCYRKISDWLSTNNCDWWIMIHLQYHKAAWHVIYSVLLDFVGVILWPCEGFKGSQDAEFSSSNFWFKICQQVASDI